jgi:hypothetical protein
MSYISQEDYKNLMLKFQAETPKGLLKEMHSMDHDGHDEHHKLTADAEEGLEREGNAFTAGLAKTKKGGTFKVGGKTVKDTSNYDSDLEEYQFDDMYPNDPGPFEEGEGVCPSCGMPADQCQCGQEMDESHPGMDKWYEDFENGLQNLVKNGYIHKNMYKYFHDALDHIDPMEHYGHMPAHDAAKEFVDDLRTKDAMQADKDQFKRERGFEEEVQKFQEIAGIHSHDDGPEDDDEEAREARAKKMEDDDTEAENAEMDEKWDSPYDGGADDLAAMSKKPNYEDPYALAVAVADAHPELQRFALEDRKMFHRAAFKYADELMTKAGIPNRHQVYLVNDEDWAMDYISALGKELEGMDEGLHMPPLQATGQTIQTVEEDAITNPGMGFGMLSPDERKQLREYINSYKTIKKEIAGLLEKAGKSGNIMENMKKEEDEKVPAARKAKYHDPTAVPTQHKHSNLGGNRTGLVMTKAEMWENEEGAHERIEGMLDTKLHDAFHKVTGMIMKDLMDDGFDEGDIKNFLQHEIEEKAKEAINAQHDF